MRRLLLATALLITAACGEQTLAPLPFEVTLEASRTTAAQGDSINFLVTAQGGSLLGADIDYADLTTDAFGTSGARTARITFRHAYSVTGIFQVRVVVTDAVAGQKEATVQVVVN